MSKYLPLFITFRRFMATSRGNSNSSNRSHGYPSNYLLNQQLLQKALESRAPDPSLVNRRMPNLSYLNLHPSPMMMMTGSNKTVQKRTSALQKTVSSSQQQPNPPGATVSADLRMFGKHRNSQNYFSSLRSVSNEHI